MICIGILILLIIACVSYFLYEGEYFFSDLSDYYSISVDTSQALFQTDEKFLSVALDTSFMYCLFHKLSEGEWKKLQDLTSLLTPGYLRLGGTAADKALFNFDPIFPVRNINNCSEENLIITGEDWKKIYNFANKSGLNFLIDLNVLLRTGSYWNSSNAEALIDFSEKNGFSLDFQLGNEPNSFQHVFNFSITGQQLAKDFRHLRNILNSSRTYRSSKLVGPDVTRPKNLERSSLEFLKNFLSQDISVDAVSWHQYYLNGRTATLDDFINPEVFDEFPAQVKAITEVVRNFSEDLPIWLSETSSAYGGGAPYLSNKFVASFLWLDKLGVAAKSGISVVIRQSLFKDHYALISSSFEPSPDFWISFFYKNLVGSTALSVTRNFSNQKHLRFYCHCLAQNSPVKGSFIVFAMNLSNKTETVVVTGANFDYPVHSFTFRPENENLKNNQVLLNDQVLLYDRDNVYDVLKNSMEVKLPLVLPKHSIAFWIFKESKDSVCVKA